MYIAHETSFAGVGLRHAPGELFDASCESYIVCKINATRNSVEIAPTYVQIASIG